MPESEMTKCVLVYEYGKGSSARGQPPVEWKDKVREYMRERG